MVKKVREIVRCLSKEGWELVNVAGSHHRYTHPNKPGKVTIAFEHQSSSRVERMTFGVIVHRAGASWNAYVPDLDGVVATASTRERVIELITEAVPLHLRGLAEQGRSAESSEAFTLAVAAS